MAEVEMKVWHFVLVHGAAHGAWCWYKVQNLLEQSGHKVTCVDLAAAGIDMSDPKTVLTFDDYNRPLVDLISALPEDEKVVLVGHSAGGFSVTSIMRQFSHKVAAAVYVGAIMLRNGFATEEDRKAGFPDLSEWSEKYDDFYVDGNINPKYRRMLLYGMSPPEDVVLASMLSRPYLLSKDETFQGDEGGVDKVRRLYVRTIHDKLVKPTQQDMMINLWPCKVVSVESDHCPFFSAPKQLCDVLLKLIRHLPYY